MFYRIIVTVWFCLSILLAFSQKQPRGYSQYSNDILYYPTKNIDTVWHIANRLLQGAEEKGNEQEMAKAFSDIAFVYRYKGQPDSAIYFYKKSKNIFLATKNYEPAGYTDIALSKIYIGQYKIDTALSYLIRADSIGAAFKNATILTDVKWNMGLLYKNKEDYLTAAKFFNSARDAYYLQKNFPKYILASCHLSMAYRLMDKNDSSLLVLAQCKSVFVKQPSGNSLLYASIQENYADTYMEIGKYAEALTYFKEALFQFQKLGCTVEVAYENYSIGTALAEMNRFNEAESYLQQSYMLSDSLKIYKYLVWISNAFNNMYAKMGDWKNAYNYLQKKNDWLDTIDISDQIEKVNALNGKFETEKKEHEIAVLKSKNQITKWWFLSSFLLALITSLLLWLYYARKKIKEQKILNYFATSLYNQNTVDDVFWDIAKNCISQLNFQDCVIYGYDEARNMLLQKAAFGPKNPDGHIISNLLEIPVGKGIVGAVAASLKPEIINDTRKDSRYLVDDMSRNSEIAVPIMVDGKLLGVIDSEHSVVGFFTKRHLELLQKIADICAKKLTRNFVEEGLRKKIARDLHDDMGSTLSSINIISKVALQQSSIEGHLKNQLTSIKDYSLHMMESMSDMVWAINPDNDSIESLVSKMKEWAAEICEPREVQLYFESSAGIENIKLDTEKRKHFFLIFKEAINNAIKYSQCKNIHVHMNKTAAAIIRMSIMDDGIGFNMQDHKKGNGLLNMQARAHQLQAEMNIKSTPGKGTTIELLDKIA